MLRPFPPTTSPPAAAMAALRPPPPSSAVASTESRTSRPSRVAVSANASRRRAAVAEVQSAIELIPTLSKLKDVLELQDLNTILRLFGEQRRWKEVVQVFDWMQKHEKVNFVSYSGFFKYMGISRNPVRAMQIYDSIGDDSVKINVSVCNSILGCMVRNGKFESSMQLFNRMKGNGLSPDLFTYSTLLTGCTKVEHGYSKAMQLVQELQSKGFQMDGVIYGSLLAICASNSLCEEAEAFFQQMKNDGCPPNLYHYSSLLNAYSSTGDHKKADKLMKEMKSLGLEPNKVTLTNLLKVYARTGLFEKSKELLADLQSLGYADDEMPYCLLMDNFAKSGCIEDAECIFAEMKDKKAKSEGFAYSIMISAYCRCRRLKEAKQLAEEFESNYAKYDLVMLNTLLRAYCNVGDIENVMRLLRKMDSLMISPDWNTFHILIKYFSKEKLYQLAFRTVEDMRSKGYPLDEELCSSLILQLGNSGFSSEALSVYNLLRYSKRTVCKTMHEKMLGFLVAGGHLKDAYVLVKDNAQLMSTSILEKFSFSFMKFGNINWINDVLKTLHRSGFQIGGEIFHEAVERYIATPEKKDLLLHMLQWMSGHGYAVNPSSRNLLLKNSDLFGQKQFIADILSKQHTESRKLRSRDMHKIRMH